MGRELLGGVGEGGDLDAADLALSELLVLDAVGVDVGVLGGRGVLDVGRQLDALVVVALAAVLRDLPVGLRVEVLRLHRRDVPHVPGHVRLQPARARLPLLALSRGHVTHVPHDCRLLRPRLRHHQLQILSQNIIWGNERKQEGGSRKEEGMLSPGSLAASRPVLPVIIFKEHGRGLHPVHAAQGQVLPRGLLGRNHLHPAHAQAREERELTGLLPQLLQGHNHQRGPPHHRRRAARGQGHAGGGRVADRGGAGGGGGGEAHPLPVPELDGGQPLPDLLPARLGRGHPPQLQDAGPAPQPLPGQRPRPRVLRLQHLPRHPRQRHHQGRRPLRLQPPPHAARLQAGARDRDGAVYRDGRGAGVDAEGVPGGAGAHQPLRQHQVAGPRSGRLPGPPASESIQAVTCPTFFLHGRRDDLVSPDNTNELAKLCPARKQVLIPPDMTHSTFDFYSDLADPLREFLMHNGFNFYEPNQQGPQLPDSYFQFPPGFS